MNTFRRHGSTQHSHRTGTWPLSTGASQTGPLSPHRGPPKATGCSCLRVPPGMWSPLQCQGHWGLPIISRDTLEAGPLCAFTPPGAVPGGHHWPPFPRSPVTPSSPGEGNPPALTWETCPSLHRPSFSVWAKAGPKTRKLPTTSSAPSFPGHDGVSLLCVGRDGPRRREPKQWGQQQADGRRAHMAWGDLCAGGRGEGGGHQGGRVTTVLPITERRPRRCVSADLRGLCPKL